MYIYVSICNFFLVSGSRGHSFCLGVFLGLGQFSKGKASNRLAKENVLFIACKMEIVEKPQPYRCQVKRPEHLDKKGLTKRDTLIFYCESDKMSV